MTAAGGLVVVTARGVYAEPARTVDRVFAVLRGTRTAGAAGASPRRLAAPLPRTLECGMRATAARRAPLWPLTGHFRGHNGAQPGPVALHGHSGGRAAGDARLCR